MRQLVLEAVTTFVGVALIMATGYNLALPPCQEDEAYVVMEDADPYNGLRWGCIALDDLHAHLDGRTITR